MDAVRRGCLVVFGACLALAVLQCAAAATYDVGGTAGWVIPSTNTKLYSDWVKTATFKVGDKLVFKFTTNSHNVYRVSKADYDKCATGSPMEKYETGPATITLNTTGHHYYICAYPTHCTNGQKVSIKVSTATASSPGGSPSPSPVGSPTVQAPSSSQSQSPSTKTPTATSPSSSKSAADHSSTSAVATFLVVLFGFAMLFL